MDNESLIMDSEYINKGEELLKEFKHLKPLFLEDEGKYAYPQWVKNEAVNLLDNIREFQKELEIHLSEKTDEFRKQYMERNCCTYERIPNEILNVHFNKEGFEIFDRIMVASCELTGLLYKRW